MDYSPHDEQGRMEEIVVDAVSEIHASTIRVARSTILSPAELMTKAKSKARNGYEFGEDEIYFWAVDASNNQVDTYFTAMAPSSLRNYAEDAEDGVAFQNSHSRSSLPLGHSLSGKFVGGTKARTSMDFYTVRGLNISGINTDEFIRGMETGLLNDVSIGFYGADYRCSICNKDMFDWSIPWEERCRHIPGIEYDTTDKSGNVTGRIVCIAYVENARLSEVSVVYDGATPGAAIRKAQSEAEAGEIRPDVVDIIEARYRIKLPNSGKRYAGVDVPDGGRTVDSNKVELEGEVKEETRVIGAGEERKVEEVAPPATEEVVEVSSRSADPIVPVSENKAPVVVDNTRGVLASALSDAGVKPGDDPIATLRALVEEIRTNRPLAKDGKQYRADLIADALDQGVRALGNDFDKEAYEELFRTASIETVKSIRDSFSKRASDAIPVGRSTVEGEEPVIVEAKPEVRKRPASVYANG